MRLAYEEKDVSEQAAAIRSLEVTLDAVRTGLKDIMTLTYADNTTTKLVEIGVSAIRAADIAAGLIDMLHDDTPIKPGVSELMDLQIGSCILMLKTVLRLKEVIENHD